MDLRVDHSNLTEQDPVTITVTDIKRQQRVSSMKVGQRQALT